MINQNLAAERAVLAGICRYGSEAYYDVCDLIRESTFTDDSKQIIYKCMRHIIEADGNAKIDPPSIYAAANALGHGYVFEKRAEVEHLQALFNFPIDIKNVRRHAGTIGRLEITRLLDVQLSQAKEELREITGEEALSHILGIAENAIFNFSSLINDSKGPQKLGEGLNELLSYLEENPVDQIGISTGYKKLDQSMGGGLRPGVTVVGARIKQGKSFFGDNVGEYIAEHECPCLNVDTEMRIRDHQMRTTAMLAEVPINDIETGKFAHDPIKKAKVKSAAERLHKVPYFHECISGLPFEEQLSVMRRWLVKEVGLKPDGTANKCVIVYDYLKLMSDESINNNIAEYQAIGFMMTGLHNFALRYNIPILAFVQLNRDGVTKETSDVAAQSDRILWLCIAFLIWKSKSDEEVAQDGPSNGNKKIVPVVSRYGEGLDSGDYINFDFKGWCGKIKELKLHSEVQTSNNGSQIVDNVFEVSEEDGDYLDVPFDAI